MLHNIDHILDPDKFSKSGFELDLPPLVVGAALTDLLGTRTHRGDGNNHFRNQVQFVRMIARSQKTAGVVHQAGTSADRGLFLDEVGKGHLDMGGCGVQVIFHLVENLRDFLERHFRPEEMEHLDKPAHMGSLVFVRQIHVHIDGGHGVLARVSLVQHSDRVPDILDAHLVDGQVAMIPLVLNIFHPGHVDAVISGDLPFHGSLYFNK